MAPRDKRIDTGGHNSDATETELRDVGTPGKPQEWGREWWVRCRIVSKIPISTSSARSLSPTVHSFLQCEHSARHAVRELLTSGGTRFASPISHFFSRQFSVTDWSTSFFLCLTLAAAAVAVVAANRTRGVLYAIMKIRKRRALEHNDGDCRKLL